MKQTFEVIKCISSSFVRVLVSWNKNKLNTSGLNQFIDEFNTGGSPIAIILNSG